MKRHLKFGLGAIAAAVIALAGCTRIYLWHRYHSERTQGAQLAARLESFEASHGKLPHSIAEIGIEETDQGRGPFFQRESDHQYKIWFGDSLGVSYVFDSTTRKWQFEG